jgi:hypothetical protein
MIPESVLKQAVWRIHSCPDLAGCIVGYYGDGMCRTIGYPSCVTLNSENVAVVIEEVVLNAPVAAMASASTTPTPASPQAKAIVTNRSKIGAELLGAGASCGLTMLSAAGVAAGAALEVPTGGASTFLMVASWSGLAMGAIQCGNGLVRVGAALANLDGDTLDRWDKNTGYSTLILIVDAIGVAGSLASLPFAVRNAWSIITRMRALATMDLSIEALRRLNRLDRFKLIGRLFQQASRTPEGAQALVAAAREVNVGARVFQRTASLSVNHSATLVRIIRDETVKRLQWSLLEVFAGVAGNTLSATPSELTGSGSGSVNWVINLCDAGSPNY